jgi:predicted PurR-regulated permease PerM
MRRRIPKVPAILVTVLLVAVGGAALAWLVGVSISQTSENLPIYQERLFALRDRVTQFLADRGIDVGRVLSLDAASPSRVIGAVKTSLSAGGQIVGNAFLIFVLVIAMLFEIVDIHARKMRGELPPHSFMARFSVYSDDIRRYVSITAVNGIIGSVAFYVVLLGLGVDNAATWAVLSFFLNFIPTFGMILTVIPPGLLAWLESGWQWGLAVVLSYVAINALMEYVVKPRFIRQGLGISPLMVLISLLFWAWVLGPVGAILAVPLTVALKRVIRFKPSPGDPGRPPA